MTDVTIFLNGEFSSGDWCKALTKDKNFIIAVDGGATHALGLGSRVDLLVGDMDSIELEDFKVLRERNVQIKTFPEEKNETDLEIALNLALTYKPKEIHLLGGEGRCFDHLLCNALISANAKFAASRIWFYEKESRSTAVHSGQILKVSTKVGSRISLIPLSAEVQNVSIKGVKWPLESQKLELGSSHTLSNKATEKELEVSVGQGILLAVIEDLNPKEVK